MSTHEEGSARGRKRSRLDKAPQRWWEILDARRQTEQPFADYFRELAEKSAPLSAAEMPWGGDSRLIEGWFTAGEELDEGPGHDAMQWPREGRLARAWTWMCAHVLPEDKTNPAVGCSDSDTD